MSEKIYDELADWLVSTFRSLPGVKTKEFMDVLHFWYTPEEAQLAVQLSNTVTEGHTIDELVEITGIDKEKLSALIKNMEEKGTMFTEPRTEEPKYWPIGMEVIGLLETVGWGDNSSPFKKELHKLWAKFKPVYVGEGVAELGKYIHAWCSVGVLPEDAKPGENLFEQLKQFHANDDWVGVSQCPCRLVKMFEEEACDCVQEACLSFGKMAQWAIEHGWARKITLEEAFDIIKKCDAKGQVNVGFIGGIICNCCKHECINYVGSKMSKEDSFLPNHFFAVSDPETCKACGTCVEYCFADCIELAGIAKIDSSKCYGCGACASTCPEGAIKMVRKSEEEIVEADTKMAESSLDILSKTKPNWVFF